MSGFFDAFTGVEAEIALAAEKMRDMGLTSDDVLRLYDEWMAVLKADMIPATTPPDPAGHPPHGGGLENAPSKRGLQAETGGGVRRRPGQADAEYRLGACPKCGSEVWGIKKCPHIAPPWRTFFACDSDACAYHGRSRLTVEQLRRKWPEGAEVE